MIFLATPQATSLCSRHLSSRECSRKGARLSFWRIFGRVWCWSCFVIPLVFLRGRSVSVCRRNHEYFQTHRRSLAFSCYHHPAAEDLEEQVLCGWAVCFYKFSLSPAQRATVDVWWGSSVRGVWSDLELVVALDCTGRTHTRLSQWIRLVSCLLTLSVTDSSSALQIEVSQLTLAWIPNNPISIMPHLLTVCTLSILNSNSTSEVLCHLTNLKHWDPLAILLYMSSSYIICASW